jgi:hypothetical protein
VRYFYDTEFLEDGRTIELISIGIVAEDGREYYAVNSEAPMDRIRADDWLMRNVVSSLPVTGKSSMETWLACPVNTYPKPSTAFIDLDKTATVVRPRQVIANEVRDFLLAAGADIELWANYAACDFVALYQLFGRMVDLPDGIPMFTNDLQQALRRAGNPSMPEQAAGMHNAIEDARHLKACYEALTVGWGSDSRTA